MTLMTVKALLPSPTRDDAFLMLQTLPGDRVLGLLDCHPAHAVGLAVRAGWRAPGDAMRGPFRKGRLRCWTIAFGLFAPMLYGLACLPDASAGPRLGARASAAAEEADPAEVAIGERLFLETRFAQFFFANSGGDANAVLAAGDPVMDVTKTTTGPVPGPFAGRSMNCRACHLVDEQKGVPGGGNRSYADFARRSPLPRREDGKRKAVRNAPSLVNASLPRTGFLMHFDGEFASARDLVKGTFTGRNFGWLPSERDQAIAHIARIVREDDGTGDLAQEFGGAYAVVLAGTAPGIPPELVLPPAFRIDVSQATDAQILDAVAALVDAYLSSLVFAQTADGEFDGSPYDRFLAKNGLPRKPDAGESDLDYARRLGRLVDGLARLRFVTRLDGQLALHDQPFRFGPRELQGLKVFLAEPAALPLDANALRRGQVGNCLVCHPAPSFTDFGFHNTGAAQAEYDAVHGPGAFVDLFVPDLAARRGNFDAYLPPTPAHPNASGPFLDIPSRDRPGRTDLGLWNVFANPDMLAPQAAIKQILCARLPSCRKADVLPKTIALFKTPGLRDLGHSGPYLHTGQADTIEDVLRQYVRFSELARDGGMRNASPPLRGMALTERDVEALAAFLRSLNEDYE